MKTENEMSYIIRGAIYKVYNALGSGLLESAYEDALCYQLQKDGLKVERQVKLPLVYDGIMLSTKLVIDILVEKTVIIELKSVMTLEPVHHKQILSYLRLSNCHLGILVNFNTSDINSNIIRKVNGYK